MRRSMVSKGRSMASKPRSIASKRRSPALEARIYAMFEALAKTGERASHRAQRHAATRIQCDRQRERSASSCSSRSRPRGRRSIRLDPEFLLQQRRGLLLEVQRSGPFAAARDGGVEGDQVHDGVTVLIPREKWIPSIEGDNNP
jgi:hypothetical protein